MRHMYLRVIRGTNEHTNKTQWLQCKTQDHYRATQKKMKFNGRERKKNHTSCNIKAYDNRANRIEKPFEIKESILRDSRNRSVS